MVVTADEITPNLGQNFKIKQKRIVPIMEFMQHNAVYAWKFMLNKVKTYFQSGELPTDQIEC